MGEVYSFPKTETLREITIERFGGVDYATHATKVDFRRSPDACNMIADDAYFPVKRTGYKRILQTGKPIYGIFQLHGKLICHSGTQLCEFDEAGGSKIICSDMNQAYSTVFLMNGKLYILDGRTYRQYDGSSVVDVSTVAFVPTTTIFAKPCGGGISFESVNLLTPKRINTFIGDGTSQTFYLDVQDIDDVAVTCSGYTVLSVDRAKGSVTLSSAPPNGNGIANVNIAFSKTIAGNAEKINKCTIFGLYGGKNDTRVFLSGNAEEKNCDWQSGLYDPTYFPDIGYTKIGSDATAVMGYIRQYDSQIVIKEDNGQDAAQYLRTYDIDDDGRAMYPLKQGAQGPGAVSQRCFGVIGNVPVYLSRGGVVGLYGTNVAGQSEASALSDRIDPRLTRENGLSKAVACEWRDKFYLAVNGRCYVADSRQKGEDGSPEWYFWDNIPAVCFLATNDRLYFGTEDGRVLRFYEKGEDGAYCDDGQAIAAYWSTPLSPLGKWSAYKTVLDFYPVLMPYTRSGTEVYYHTEDLQRRQVSSKNLDLYCFKTLDFSRFSFRSLQTATPYRTHTKIRRTFLFQGIIENKRAGEPFGLLGIVIKYTEGATIK